MRRAGRELDPTRPAFVPVVLALLDIAPRPLGPPPCFGVTAVIFRRAPRAHSALRDRTRRLFMEPLEDRRLMAVVDLTPAGAQQVTLNGAIFTDADLGGAGSGNIDAFVSIQNTGTEQGYNSSFRPVQFN